MYWIAVFQSWMCFQNTLPFHVWARPNRSSKEQTAYSGPRAVLCALEAAGPSL